MQIGPVRWIFIKSPVSRKPFTQIRKLYEVELANSKAKNLSDLEKKELLAVRERTKQVLIKKKRKEVFQSLISLIIVLAVAVVLVLVYFIFN
jgi:uncharacterized membrane protein YbhN (UPF0104 family)